MVHRYDHHAKSALTLAIIAVFGSVASPVFAVTVSSGAVVRGESSVLTISTPGSTWSTGVTVDLGDGVAVGQIEVRNPDLLLVHVDIDMNAPLGPHNVVIQQDGTYLIGSDVLQVLNEGTSNIPSGQGGTLDINIVTNPGFETGDMTGWIPVTWSVDTVLPHSGAYDAYDPGATGGGGQCLRQEFNPPVDSNTITSFSFWLRQTDNLGIAQVAVWYQIAPTQYGVAFTNDDDSWTFESYPDLLLPNDFVTAIHVCGFGGGTSDPDDSWADDFDMQASEGTPATATSWGRIKGLYR